MLTPAQQEFLTTLTADHRQRVIGRWNAIRQKIADIGEPSTLDELAHTVIGLVNKKQYRGIFGILNRFQILTRRQCLEWKTGIRIKIFHATIPGLLEEFGFDLATASLKARTT